MEKDDAGIVPDLFTDADYIELQQYCERLETENRQLKRYIIELITKSLGSLPPTLRESLSLHIANETDGELLITVKEPLIRTNFSFNECLPYIKIISAIPALANLKSFKPYFNDLNLAKRLFDSNTKQAKAYKTFISLFSIFHKTLSFLTDNESVEEHIKHFFTLNKRNKTKFFVVTDIVTAATNRILKDNMPASFKVWFIDLKSGLAMYPEGIAAYEIITDKGLYILGKDKDGNVILHESLPDTLRHLKVCINAKVAKQKRLSSFRALLNTLERQHFKYMKQMHKHACNICGKGISRSHLNHYASCVECLKLISLIEQAVPIQRASIIKGLKTNGLKYCQKILRKKSLTDKISKQIKEQAEKVFNANS